MLEEGKFSCKTTPARRCHKATDIKLLTLDPGLFLASGEVGGEGDAHRPMVVPLRTRVEDVGNETVNLGKVSGAPQRRKINSVLSSLRVPVGFGGPMMELSKC